MLTGVGWKNLDAASIPQNDTSEQTVEYTRGAASDIFEPYTGGTPYTDKYTATIVDQAEDNVTLSIENVSAATGDTTDLDVVLTDRHGVTKRSEIGKSFIGG